MELFDIMMFIYVGCLFVGAPLIGIIIALIQKKKHGINKNIEEENAIEEPENICEPKSEFIEAKVVAKRIHTQFNGVRQIKSAFWFLITFETLDGKQMEFPVSQEYFEKIKEEQNGTLVIVNGNFFDFGDGEEIIE